MNGPPGAGPRLVDGIAPRADRSSLRKTTRLPHRFFFFQTLTAYQHSGALRDALELELFTAMRENGGTATELATRCDAAERGCASSAIT